MNVEEMNPNYEQPAKSGKSWFACFGIGCVVLFLLCGVGSAVAWFTFGQQMMDVYNIQKQAVATAMESDKVQEKLGDNIVPVFEILLPEQSEDGDAKITLNKMKLKGSLAEGVLFFEIRIEKGQPPEQTKLYIEIDGEVIDLLNSDEFNLEIEEPGAAMDEEMEKPVEMEEPVGAGG